MADKTPLWEHAKAERIEDVRNRLARNIDPNTDKDEGGWTALHHAAHKQNVQLIRLLLEHNADANLQNKDGRTALHFAIDMENVRLATALLERNADINLQDKKGKTVLHYAVDKQNLRLTQLLLEHKADTNIKTKDGCTALFMAVSCNYVDLTRLLLEHNADINIKNEGGFTALHWAVFKQYVELARLLLERKADANMQEEDGLTALHWAVGRRNVELIRLFLEHGVDIYIKSNDGRTALDMAMEKKSQDIIDLIRKEEKKIKLKAVHAMQREVFSKAADIKQLERQLASMRAAEDAQQEQVLALDAKQKRTEDQIAALEKELKNQRTELDSRVFYLQSVETVYRTEAQESGIAKLGVNIKNAYDSPQTNSRLQDIHVAYKAVQSKRNEVKELGRNIRPLRKHDCGLESQMTRLNLQQQQYAAQVAEKRAKLEEVESELEKLTLAIDKYHAMSRLKQIMAGKMRMRDDMQSLLKQHVELEEVVQTLIVEQQQNAQQIASLDTKLNERREEFQGLQALLEEKKSNYRELATDMGMHASKLDANIKEALAFPQKTKHLNSIYNAREAVQSANKSMRQMMQQLDKLGNAGVMRKRRLSLVQTKQLELTEQDAPIDMDSVTGTSADHHLQVIREDYDSVLARTEDIERSENDLGAKHEHRREVEEKMSALKDEQQQNSDQVASLEAKLDETNKEHATLLMHCQSLEDDYRVRAAEIGMKGADAKITQAYTSPQTSKCLQVIYKARQSVESKSSEIKKMENEVSKMRVQEDTLNAEILDLRTQEQELEGQIIQAQVNLDGQRAHTVQSARKAMTFARTAIKQSEQELAGMRGALYTHKNEVENMIAEMEAIFAKLKTKSAWLHKGTQRSTGKDLFIPRRVCALVVGIDKYRHYQELENAVNSAKAVRQALESKGARVFYVEDCDKDELCSVLKKFVAAVQENDAVFIFFAGHGCEYHNANRLMTISKSAALNFKKDSLSIHLLLARIAQRKPSMTLVVLDCCRDELNPLKTELRGFHSTAIALSCEPNANAFDGAKRNSIHRTYTEILLKHFTTPNLEARKMLDDVNAAVVQRTEGEQEPFVNSSFYRPVALFGADGSLQQQEEICQKQTDQISEALNDRARSLEIETQEKTKRLEDKILMEDVSRLRDQVESLKYSLQTNVAEAKHRVQEVADAELRSKQSEIDKLRKQVQSLKHLLYVEQRYTKIKRLKRTRIKQLQLLDVEDVALLHKQMQELKARQAKIERRAQEAEQRAQAAEDRANAELLAKQGEIDRLRKQVKILKRPPSMQLASVSSKSAAWKNPRGRPESAHPWRPKASDVMEKEKKETQSTPRVIKKETQCTARVIKKSPDRLHLITTPKSSRKKNGVRRSTRKPTPRVQARWTVTSSVTAPHSESTQEILSIHYGIQRKFHPSTRSNRYNKGKMM